MSRKRSFPDVRVLAIDQTVEEKNGQRVVVGKTATLELTQRQAERLAVSRQLGALTLALRSIADANGSKSPDEPVSNAGSQQSDQHGSFRGHDNRELKIIQKRCPRWSKSRKSGSHHGAWRVAATLAVSVVTGAWAQKARLSLMARRRQSRLPPARRHRGSFRSASANRW